MVRSLQLVLTAAFLAAVVLLSPGSTANADSTPPKKPTTKKPVKKPAKPTVKPHPKHKKTYKVQTRNAHFHAVARRSSHSAAGQVARHLHRQGYDAHVRGSGKSYIVIARNLHWHTRMVTHSSSAAHRAAMMLHSRGLQVRII
jgi:hypothetical protein